MNSIVAWHRSQYPNSTKPDDLITLEYGDQFGLDQLKDYPDFLADYEKLDKRRRTFGATTLGEAKKSLENATHGTASTAAGAAGLLSGLLGADDVSDYFMEIAQSQARKSAKNKIAVSRIEDVESPVDALLYAGQAVGSVIPSLVEAGVSAGVGALAGSAAAPGPGTVAGGIAGLLERQAIKSLIKRGVVKEGEDLLADQAKKALLAKEIKAVAAQYGGNIATLANSYGLSSGEIYNDLASNPNIDPETAKETAAKFGLLAALPDTFLPAHVAGKFTRGVAKDESAKYLERLAKEGAIATLAEGGTEAFQEGVGIGAGRYADPTQQGDLTPEERSRILNAGLVGSIGGGIVAPIAAIPGPGEQQTETPPTQTPVAQPVATPAVQPAPVITPQTIAAAPAAQAGFGNLYQGATQADIDALQEIALRDISGSLGPMQRENELGPDPARRAQYEEVKRQLIEAQAAQPSSPAAPVVTTAPVEPAPVVAPEPQAQQAPEIPEWQPELEAVMQQMRDRLRKESQSGPLAVVPKPAPAPAVIPNGIITKAREYALNALRTPEVEVDPVKANLIRRADEDISATAASLDAEKADLESAAQKLADVVQSKPAEIEAQDAWRDEVEKSRKELERVQKNIELQQKKIERTAEAKQFVEQAEPGQRLPVADFLDTESSDLAEAQSGTGKHNGEKAAKYPAYHTKLKSESFTPELAEQLVSGASPGKDKGKSFTKRLAAFENQETGEILLTGVHKKDKKYFIGVKEEQKLKRGKGTTTETTWVNLEDLLSRKDADGNQLWVPVASLRIKEPLEGFNQKYEDFKQFKAEVEEPALSQVTAAKALAEAESSKMQARAFSGNEALEFQNPLSEAIQDTDAVQSKQPQMSGDLDEVESILGNISPTDLNSNQVKTLYETLAPYEEDLIQGFKEHTASLKGLVQASGEKPEIILRRLQASDFSSFEKFYETFDPTNYSLVQRQAAGGAKRDVGNLSQAGQRYDLRSSDVQDRLSTPDTKPVRAAKGEVTERFNALKENLQEFGVDVEVIQSDLGKELGKFSNKQNVITLALFDAQNPSVDNLRLLLHEGAHGLFASLPEPVRVAISRAINFLSDEQLNILNSTDPRIRQSNPAGLSAPILSEERFAEHLAIQGLNQPAAQGIASALVRFIKAVYFRVAMGLQKAFGRNPSPELALAYATNKFNQITAGDTIFRMISPPESPMARWLRTETVGGIPIPYNESDARYSIPEGVGDRENPKVIIETEIAGINQYARALDSAASELAKVDGEIATLDPAQRAAAVAEIARVANPSALLEAQLSRVDPTTGKPFTDLNALADPSSFQAEQNQARANRMAYRMTQQAEKKVGNRISKLENQINETEQRHTDAVEQHDAALLDYANYEKLSSFMVKGFRSMISQATKEISEASVDKGMINQQLMSLGEGKKTLREFAPALRKLFTGDELGYSKLISFLDSMANDPDIDFTRPIREIKDQILNVSYDPKYEGLIKDTPESKALLATVVAYAKRNKIMVEALALRKNANLEERKRINENIRFIREQQEAALDKLPGILKASQKERKLYEAMLTARADLKATKNILEESRKELKRLQTIQPFLQGALNRAAGELGLAPLSTFGDGMAYFVPPSPDATEDAIRANKKTLKLNAKREVTSEKELQDHIAAQAEFLARRDDLKQFDAIYYAVKAQNDQLVKFGVITPSAEATEHGVFKLFLSDIGTRFAAMGTTAAKKSREMVLKYVNQIYSKRPEAVAKARETMRMRDDLLKFLAQGSPEKEINLRWLKLNVYEPAQTVLENQRDILEMKLSEPERLDLGVKRAVKFLISRNPQVAAMVKGREGQFQTLLRKYLESNGSAFKWTAGDLTDQGVGVQDEALLVRDENNQMVPGIRQRQLIGLATAPRTVSQLMRSTFQLLKTAGWDKAPETFKKAAEMYNTLGPDEVRNNYTELFTPEIWRDFAGQLAEGKDTSSAFHAPMLKDGVTVPEADPEKTVAAYRKSGGDFVTFAENLYDLHNGETDKGAYIQSVLETMARYYNDMRRIEMELSPESFGIPASIKGMVSGFMVNSRSLEHWPSAWTEHLEFDERTTSMILHRTAAEIAFGINNERLDKAIQTTLQEAEEDQKKLKAAIDKVERAYAGVSKKKFKKALEDEVGGEAELKRLERSAERIPLLKRSVSDLIEMFRGHMKELKTISLGRRMVGTLTHALISKPSTAMAQLADVFNPLVQLGLSPATIKATANSAGFVLSDIAESLMNGIGFTVQQQNEEQKLYARLNLGDSGFHNKLGDLMVKTLGPDASFTEKIGTGLSKFNEALAVPINMAGNKAKGVGFTPLSPFRFIASITNKAATLSLFRMVSTHLDRMLQAVEANPLLDPNMTAAEWAKKLGYGKQDARSFDLLFSKLRNDYGLSFGQLLQDAAKNKKAGKYILSDATAQLLNTMSLTEVASESNFANMPPSAYNNTILRYMLPLLGWAFRRTMAVTNSLQTRDGKVSMAAAAQSIAALAFMTGGGMAVAALVDYYNKELLKKKRNLRPFSTDLSVADNFKALIERSTRVGTFGFYGDLINMAVNVGTGEGDNRELSLDSRVVAVHSFKGLLDALSTLINQRDLDYANVVRPAAQSVGLGGVLEGLQLINVLTGADNAEARYVQRINVNNWLRVQGRQLGLEVNTAKGGYSTPTPMTPHITRMVMAAYANNPQDFADAYRDAIDEAKARGEQDPAKFVARSFASRHPSRTVFRGGLTEGSYSRILASLPDDGREAVSSAIYLFDQYGGRIGVKPQIKDDKETPPAKPSSGFGSGGYTSLLDSRTRGMSQALGALRSGSIFRY